MKKIGYSLTAIAFMLIGLASCVSSPEKNQNVETEIPKDSEEAFVGSFVSEGYEKKNSGADWVSVTITRIRENLFHVEVRSRSDIKKPTCTFTSDVHLNKKGELVTSEYNPDIGFRISGENLSIYSPSGKELNYFCSGGATLAGKYKRISGRPDQKQVDHAQFWKFLEYGGSAFAVRAENNILAIQPNSANEVKIPFKGSVPNAEVADLDNDGFPEVYVYIREERDQHIRLEAYYLDGDVLRKISFNSKDRLQPEEKKEFYGRDEYNVNEDEGVLQRLFPIKGTKNFHFVEYILETENGVKELRLRSISTTNMITGL